MNLKEYYKNRLLNNLLEGVEGESIVKGTTRRQISRGWFEDPTATAAAARSPEGVDSTVANILDPRGRVMGRDFELESLRRAAQRAAARDNAFIRIAKQKRSYFKDPERTSAARWAKTSFVRDEESSSPPTEEEKVKKETTRRLLNTVHYFSREHGIQLKPEHIEGIDFSNPDFQSHINTVSSRLGL